MNLPEETLLKSAGRTKFSPRIITFGLVCVLLFVLNSIVFRFLLPLGDEPDYYFRLLQLEDTSRQPVWSPYVLMSDWVGAAFDLSRPACQMESSPLSVIAKINPATCSEPASQAFVRLALLLLVVPPLFVAASLRLFSSRFVVSSQSGSLRIPTRTWQTVLSLALTFPSMVYYLGLLSVEQFVLVLSLLAILTWNSLPLQIILISFAAALDAGNSIVLAAFILLTRVVFVLETRLSFKTLILSLVGLVAIVYLMGSNILTYVALVPALREQSLLIYMSMQDNIYVAKYPVLLRPVITFLNFVFSTPASLKVPLAYLAVGAALIVSFKRARRLFRRLREEGRMAEVLDMRVETILTLCSISVILVFVFAAPTYANAKYYIFLLPIFLLLPLRIFGKWRLLLFSQLLTSLVVVQLMAFRIAG
jgi:hypothetical protein